MLLFWYNLLHVGLSV